MNRTLLETARSVLSHSKVPNEFWTEAVSTATYVRNRSPTTSVKDVTPFECLFNRKPDVSNLRVFGCIAYAHIPDSMRKKLEEKSRKCVYPEGTKGFKLYDLSKKSFIRSGDMTFDEKKFHDFNDGHLSKPNPEFYHPASDEAQSEEPTVQNEAENANDQVAEENIPIPVRPVNENHNEAVGETYEENFMEEVRNLNPRSCILLKTSLQM